MAVGTQKAKKGVLWEEEGEGRGGRRQGVEPCLALLEAKQMED